MPRRPIDRTSPIGRRGPGGQRYAIAFHRRHRLLLIAFMLPGLAWVAAAQGYPLLDSLWLSFQHWSLATSPTPQGFAGLTNYREVLNDPQFRSAFLVSLLFVASVPVELIIGLLLAYFTVGESRWLRGARSVLILPMVIAPIAVGIVWRLLLDDQTGPVNVILRDLGLNGPNWLGAQTPAVISVLGADVWEWFGFSMIIYVAAIGSIDPNVIAGARVDGCNRRQLFRHIIVPLIMPSTALILIFRAIDAFLVIDVIYTLTYGGPGTSTTAGTLYIYNQGLKYFNISQAAAASWLLMTVCVAIAIVLLRIKTTAERRIA